jgi:hypothetical protein
VRRLIPLAFLSPSIVEAIADGRQPVSLTAEALSRGIDIPGDWDKQFAALGFDQRIVTQDGGLGETNLWSRFRLPVVGSRSRSIEG